MATLTAGGGGVLRTITGTDDRGYPTTVTVSVEEPAPPGMLVGVTVDPDLLAQRRWPGSRICRVFGYPGEGIPQWTSRPYKTRKGVDNRLSRLAVAQPDAIPNIVWRDWPDDPTVASMVNALLADLPPELPAPVGAARVARAGCRARR